MGDVLVRDAGGTLSDIIRFNSTGVGNGTLVFYSLGGGSSLADSGFPSANYANVITVTESSTGTIDFTPPPHNRVSLTASLPAITASAVPMPPPPCRSRRALGACWDSLVCWGCGVLCESHR